MGTSVMTSTKRKTVLKKSAAGLLAAAGVLALGQAHAVSLTIKVTNTQDVSAEGNGLSLTPFWFGFFQSQATFDAFDAGSAASAAVEQIAELGGVGGLDADLAAAQASATSGVAVAPGGVAGTIDPGETATLVIDVDPSSQSWVQFLSMVVPTNDTFVGLDNAVQLFDAMGNFLGPQSFDLTLANTYDAGTEANEFLNGAAFLAGVDALGGTQTDGVVGPALPTDFSRQLLADGATFLDPVLAAAFFGGQTNLGRVTIELTPDAQVPVPAAAFLFGGVVAGYAGLRRKKRASAA